MDVPTGQLYTKWLKQKDCAIVVSLAPTKDVPKPSPIVVTGLKGKYILATNAPEYKLVKGKYEFSVRAPNVKKPSKDANVNFKDSELSLDQSRDLKLFAAMMNSEHASPFFAVEHVKAINAFLFPKTEIPDVMMEDAPVVEDPKPADTSMGNTADTEAPQEAPSVPSKNERRKNKKKEKKHKDKEELPDVPAAPAPEAAPAPQAAPVPEAPPVPEAAPAKGVPCIEAAVATGVPHVPGLHFMSFISNAETGFWFDDKPKAAEQDDDLERMMKALNTSGAVAAFTIIWGPKATKKAVHEYWVMCMDSCIWNGLWHFYNYKFTQGIDMLRAFINDPDKPLDHQH
jgi:hypothetical protein